MISHIGKICFMAGAIIKSISEKIFTVKCFIKHHLGKIKDF